MMLDAIAAAIEQTDVNPDRLETGALEEAFDRRGIAILDYARTLTHAPNEVTEMQIAALHDAGLSDGEILKINQVASYFAYVNRTVLGLGVPTQGDALGLSPGDASNAENWRHS